MGAGERPRVVVSRALPPGWLGDLAVRCELTIGGPEPDNFSMVGAEIEIYNSTDDVVMGTTTTDASGAYFFDGDSLGLDVNKIYFVRPTDAERAKHVPLDWFPGQATIAAPPADMVYTCTDINLLATEV